MKEGSRERGRLKLRNGWRERRKEELKEIEIKKIKK